jgi:hypothetical protein
MRILLALSLVLVLARPAEAILVEGTISASIFTDFGPNISLRGEEFSIVSGGNSADIPLSGFFFPSRARVDQPVDVSNTSPIRTRGSITYQGEAFAFPTFVTGALTFDVEPFLFQEGPPTSTGRRTFHAEPPFTMTGQLSFAGHTVTLEGSGILTVPALDSPPGPIVEYDFVRGISYNFSPIPEPGTLLLFGTAAGLGALYGLRKRRGSR